MATTTTRTPEQVLADLRKVAKRIAVVDPQLKALYDQRRALFAEGREVDPPVTHPALAEAAGISEPMVVRTLTKLAADAAKAPAGT